MGTPLRHLASPLVLVALLCLALANPLVSNPSLRNQEVVSFSSQDPGKAMFQLGKSVTSGFL